MEGVEGERRQGKARGDKRRKEKERVDRRRQLEPLGASRVAHSSP